MRPLAAELAHFVVGSQLRAIPDSIKHEATRAFVNWVGCVLGGITDPTTLLLESALKSTFGASEATVFGRGLRIDVPNVALLNCLASTVHGFDDTHVPTIIHPTGPVAAAATAFAETKATRGADLLHALLIGIELECRLGNALLAPPATTSIGFLPTALTGAIGAAVAGAKLLNLDADRTMSAIGIAACSAAGLRETIGSMAAPFALACPARNGAVATLLAERRFSATATTLDGPKGLLKTYGNPPNPKAVLEGLGQRFELTTNTFKPYPCGVWVHAAVDVCLNLVRAHDLQPGTIARVRLKVNPRALTIAGRKEPSDRVEAQASLYHWAAVALLRQRATLAEAENDVVRDTATVAMRKRIAITAEPGYRIEEASGEIEFHDGRVIETHVPHCRGSIWQPMSDDELGDKFMAQAQHVLPERQARRLLEDCWGVAAWDDVGAVLRLHFPA